MNNGSFKRFSEVWRAENVMKRCSWQSNREGVTKSQVVSFGIILNFLTALQILFDQVWNFDLKFYIFLRFVK